MISYKPFWKTLKEKGISTYYLIHKCKVSSSTLTRMRKNESITMVTINDLCRILDCKIEDIAEYIPSEDDQKL